MNINVQNISSEVITCKNCQACCCRLEVMIISETGVPEKYITENEYGGAVMARLSDGWCVALDRKTMRCTIYENRPWVCREFVMAGVECISERTVNC